MPDAVQATAPGETGIEERARRSLLPAVIMCAMAGAGFFIAIASLTEGRIMGFVIGTIWTVALLTMGLGRLVKRVLGLDRPTVPKGGRYGDRVTTDRSGRDTGDDA